MTFETQTDSSGLPTTQFDVVMRGYDRSQVDEHIARLHEEMRHLAAGLRQERDLALTRSHQLAAERDNALEHLYATQDELEALRNQKAAAPAAAHAARASHEEISLFGDRLQTILATAEQEASQVRAEAESIAQNARAEAQRQADEILNDAKQRAQAMLADAREKAAQVTGQATRDAEQIAAKANQQAASTLDSIKRDERDTRASLAKLLQRREQVRADLTRLSETIQSLLAEEQSAQRSDNGQTGAPQEQPQEQQAPPNEQR
jgi:DivIVA domain-containing protein